MMENEMKNELSVWQDEGIKAGNWVPVKMIIVPAAIGLLCLAAGGWLWGFYIAGVLFLLVAVYFAVAYYLISPAGRDMQPRVYQLLLDHIDWDGQGSALDIGCGNGMLTLSVARRFPEAEVTGIDYWGVDWDFSIQNCNQNAEKAGVASRVSFRKGSALELPFEEGSFDFVFSNLVFHEVREAADKRDGIREALRVLKPGGRFVLQDLLLLKPYYGTPDELLDYIRSLGIEQVEFIRTCDEPFIPTWLKLPFMLGTLAIVRGVK